LICTHTYKYIRNICGVGHLSASWVIIFICTCIHTHTHTHTPTPHHPSGCIWRLSFYGRLSLRYESAGRRRCSKEWARTGERYSINRERTGVYNIHIHYT
jgi:hypothetical protein